MLDTLIELDKELLLFFNGSNSLYLDQVMWVVTGKIIWIPLILSLLWLFFKQGWKEGLLVVLMVALTVVLCDQVSSGICKPLFERWRPSQDPEFSQFVTIVNGYRGGRFGFISGHAANAFGIVLFSSLLFKNRFYTFSVVIWALLSCYSRMYLGVHYPGDILFGALAGALCGYLCYRLYEVFHKKIFGLKLTPYAKNKGVIIPLCFLYGTYVLILVFAPIINFNIK